MRVFIAYDFQIRGGLPDQIDAVAESPGENCEVAWTGAEHGRSQGDLWREIVEPGIRDADRFVAFVDKPNANVGFEIGYALGLGRKVALARCCPQIPSWLDLPPLAGMMCEQANEVGQLRRLIHRRAGDWGGSARPETRGDGVLYLCPEVCGSAYLGLQHESWKQLPRHGWSVIDLPTMLTGIGAVVWVIAPHHEGELNRDGQENAAYSVVAGYASAIDDVDLIVLRHSDARSVADVVVQKQEFSVRGQLAQLLIQLHLEISGKARHKKGMDIGEGQFSIARESELRLLYEQTLPSLRPFINVIESELDVDLLVEFAASEGLQVSGRSEWMSVLQKLHLVTMLTGAPKLHRASALCFTVAPERYIPQAVAKFVLLRGTVTEEIKEVKGSLTKQIVTLLDLLTTRLRIVSSLNNDGLRVESLEFPKELLRELISNAISHRDYDQSGNVHVRVFDDRVEIENPGTFPPGLTWDSLLESITYHSNPRDAAICRYLTALRGSEGVGRGITAVRSYINANGPNCVRCIVENNKTVIALSRRTVNGADRALDREGYDLFISYSREDDRQGQVAALVEHIKREHLTLYPNDPIRIFFNQSDINSTMEWARIYRGLIESKTMLAILSPAYFSSEWCRREYETFAQQQLKHTYPGEAIYTIYIHPHHDFDGNADHPQRGWFDTLKKKQFLDAISWWADGRQALQRDVVVRRLKDLRENIWERVCDARTFQNSPTNLPNVNLNFVGRERELTELWLSLRLNQKVAVAAVQGVGGLGKTALAHAYAHSRRGDYPGGQFEIAMENITTVDGLKVEIIRLANTWLGTSIPDELINTNLNAAFAQARAAFERRGQGNILLILDNVVADDVLSQRSSILPTSEHVHVLATTRLDPERWDIKPLRLESLSMADALDLFLKYRPFEIPDSQDWYKVRQNGYKSEGDETQSTDDAEWKAAVGIVNRLGGHALAVELVAVYLGKNRSILLQNYLNGLIRKGTSLKLGQASDDPKVRAAFTESIETNIIELFKPTLEKLQSENRLAMRALRWAARMPPDYVPWIWLRELTELDFSQSFNRDEDEPDPWHDGVVRILRGWQLLTGDEQAPTCRIHRIVQAAVIVEPCEDAAAQTPWQSDDDVDRLISYMTTRCDEMKRNWGRPGINWELTPLFEAAQMLMPVIGVRVGPLVDRLIVPLRQDGRLLPALKLQQRLMELLESRATNITEHAGYVRDLYVTYSKTGDLFRVLGNLTAAREFYQKALEVSERLAASAPENAHFALDLSAAFSRLGELCHSTGESMQAMEFYQREVTVQARLVASEPENVQYSRDLSVCYERLGDLFRALGNGTQAREFLEKALDVSERLASSAPENDVFARDLSVSYNKMGDLYRALGNGTRAQESYEKALYVIERLAASAPDNADHARDLSVSYNRMGDLFASLGHAPHAREYYDKALEIIERLAASAPENADHARDLSVSYSRMGDLFRAIGNGVGALVYYEKALEVSERLAATAPDNADYARDLCVSCVKIAGIKEDDHIEAVNWWRRACDILQDMVGRGLHVSPEDLNLLEKIKSKIMEEST